MTSLGIITITQSTVLHYDNGIIEDPKTETGNEEAVRKEERKKKKMIVKYRAQR